MIDINLCRMCEHCNELYYNANKGFREGPGYYIRCAGAKSGSIGIVVTRNVKCGECPQGVGA